ncbi:MAG TPA: hypothetical protein VES19_12000 [Candidatus Limnocylindrales bacterium]|nr:hypothetical protein [Candidatus Limnocylindrales bacterium]
MTETDTRPWIDCLWASAAMLADKWTNGEIRVTHGELRHLSGDLRGGSTFADVQVAFRKLGLSLELNANGDSILSWSAFLARLRNGAGAVVLGDQGQLPRWFGRWDYRFWRKTGEGDNHALYVERYDRRRGRVWIMDPLARGDWKGEWLSVSALRRFAWFKGGSVVAVTTPTARAAPFANVVAERPQVGIGRAAVTATWRLRAPRGWRYPGADVKAAINPASDPIAAAIATARVAPRTTADAAPEQPTAGVSGHTLRLSAAIPTEPGAYTASFSLTDRRFGSRFVASAPVAIFVPGARRATMRLNVPGAFVTAGGEVRINLSVANTGKDTWAETVRVDGEGEVRQRSTRVVATWVLLDSPGGDDAASEAIRDADSAMRAPLVFELRRLPLAPGRIVRIRQALVVPDRAGRWALVVDIVDDVAGSFASLGSAPAVALFEVVPPRGIEAVE